MNGIMKKMLHDVELNNPAEKEEIEKVEKELSIVFPEDYKNFMIESNGLEGEIGEERYTYTGSFDFKLTAIAKILDINKNILKESKFIASDLL